MLTVHMHKKTKFRTPEPLRHCLHAFSLFLVTDKREDTNRLALEQSPYVWYGMVEPTEFARWVKELGIVVQDNGVYFNLDLGSLKLVGDVEPKDDYKMYIRHTFTEGDAGTTFTGLSAQCLGVQLPTAPLKSYPMSAGDKYSVSFRLLDFIYCFAHFNTQTGRVLSKTKPEHREALVEVMEALNYWHCKYTADAVVAVMCLAPRSTRKAFL